MTDGTDIAEGWDSLRADLQAVDILLDLVTDTAWIARLHRRVAAARAFGKAATDTQDDHWQAEADRLMREYRDLLQNSAPYDSDADDVEDTKPADAADEGWFWMGGGRRS